jgi:hypothetical protein
VLDDLDCSTYEKELFARCVSLRDFLQLANRLLPAVHNLWLLHFLSQTESFWRKKLQMLQLKVEIFVLLRLLCLLGLEETWIQNFHNVVCDFVHLRMNVRLQYRIFTYFASYFSHEQL